MKTVDCIIYYLGEDYQNSQFIELVKLETGMDHNSALDLIFNNESITFKNVTRDHAVGIISKFEEIGVVGSIGPLKKKYQNKFRSIILGRKIQWNLWVFVFQYLWLFFSGMWVKLFAYMCLSWSISSKLLPASISVVANVIMWLYLGVMITYDYYLYKTKNEKLWPMLPYKKVKLVFWIVFLVMFVFSCVKPVADGVVWTVDKFKNGFTSMATVSLDNSKYIFSKTPETWSVFEGAPLNFSYEVTKNVGENRTVGFSHVVTKGTKMFGSIQLRVPKVEEGDVVVEAEKSESVALVVVEEFNPLKFKKFNVANLRSNEDTILDMMEEDNYPLYMKWLGKWIKEPMVKVNYKTISAVEWGIVKVRQVIGRAVVRTDKYWLVLDDETVLFVTFRTTEKDYELVKLESLAFMESFKLRERDVYVKSDS